MSPRLAIVIALLLVPAMAQAQTRSATDLRAGSARSASPATADDLPALPRPGDLAGERQYLRALEAIIGEGRLARARSGLDRFNPTTPYGAVMQSFLFGLVARGEGRFQEAVDRFRGILNDFPHLARVRGELAATLLAMNEDDGARHHLELLRPVAAGTDGEARVNAAIAALDERRPWSLNLFFGMAPSTNMNNGTSARVFTLAGLPFVVNDSSRARSGVGAAYGIDAGYRFRITDHLELVTAGFAQVRDFQNIEFDQTVYGGQIGPRLRFDTWSIGVAATHANDVRGGVTSNIKNGVRIHGSYQLSPRFVIAPDIEVYGRRFPLAPLFSVTGWTAGMTATYAIDSHVTVRAMTAYGEEGAPIASNSSRSTRFGAGLFWELPFAVSIYVEGNYRRVNFNGESIFGGKRLDDRYDATVRVTKRDWIVFGFAPQFEYSYSRIISNQALFGQESHGLSVIATRRF